jgi:mono/diheme cytochrome c family protein
MNEQEKKDYLETYKQEKEKGVPFYPDLLFKDALVALLVFIVLAGLAFFLGAPLEERADPSDTSYTPRPEWYFLFLFQLLKYFPGQLEVIGVIVLPSLIIALIVALPFLDRTSKRHFRHRPWIIGSTIGLVAAVIILTALSIAEAPPPSIAEAGDQTAALYTQNCATCHGPSIEVDPGLNLHEIIAQGQHEGMPAWSADLTSDEIDSLAGFILSRNGSVLFTDFCAECHDPSELVASNPLVLRDSLQLMTSFEPHGDLDIPNWNEVMTTKEQNDLINFLIAPDGQRLFAINCASCHGTAITIPEDEQELRTIIVDGGLHLEMPAWRNMLSNQQLDILAQFIVDPLSNPGGAEPFSQYCSSCHGRYIPVANNVDEAREIISSGGSHETMPIWGEILTSQQVDALVSYTQSVSRGTPLERGLDLYVQNCSSCHGDFGEGGVNPARTNDIIAPISSAEYLKTRDDATLRAIIAEGQPNFGMAPFSTAFGGPLDDEEIDAIIAFIRAWELNPPVDLPIEVSEGVVLINGAQIYAAVCAQCHGVNGEGGAGPSLRDADFQLQNSDEDIFSTINRGHDATSMIAWGEILTSGQIQELVDFIRTLAITDVGKSSDQSSFSEDVLPIFDRACNACHGSLGGWDGSSYETVMTSGNNAPVVIPGDPDNSLLIQKLLGTQTEGTIMPPSGALPDREIQIVINWIQAGARE